MNWEPQKPVVDQSEGAIYRPEAYGTPDGTSATDAPLIAAAIAAAGAAGGGVVRLDGSYTVKNTGTSDMGPHSDVSYAIWVNADHVILDGNETGVIVLEDVPTGGKYYMIHIGDGGYIDGQSWPGPDYVIAHQKTGNIVRGLTIDCNTNLTDEERITLAGGWNFILMFSACNNFLMDNITVQGCWGGVGCYGTSRDGTIQNITIDKYFGKAIWVDGGVRVVIDNVTISDVDLTEAEGAITLANNGDFRTVSRYNTVRNCTVSASPNGIAIAGQYHTIEDNEITLTDLPATTRMGISMNAWSVEPIEMTDEPSFNTVTGNTVNRVSETRRCWGVYSNGGVGYDDGILYADENIITGNNFTGDLSICYVMGPYTVNNEFTGNTYDAGITVSADNSGGTQSNNTISGNTQNP